MFRSKTLFIVGAGANTEINMPMGSGLKDKIVEALSFEQHDYLLTLSGGDPTLRKAIDAIASVGTDRGKALVKFYAASQEIVRNLGLASSIDNFLDNHQKDIEIELCAKMAIAQAIIDAERNSFLYFDENVPWKLKETWYTKMFRLVTEPLYNESVSNIFHNISFVTFNYDRCIEHFWFSVLTNYFRMNASAAAELIANELRVHHPYGSLGTLPWQNGNIAAVPFGGAKTGYNLESIARRIRTFTEQKSDRSVLEAIHQDIADAEVVVFLGFAYGEMNLVLLHADRDTSVRKIYGTAYETSENDREILKDRLLALVKKTDNPGASRERANAILRDMKCQKLFEEYQRSISQ